jgi:hypothetical protein
VAYHLRERNRKHFGKAAGTPFTVPLLNKDLRFDGQGEATEDILTGEYLYKGHDPYVNLLLERIHLTAQVHRHPMQPTITEKEFTGKLKAWRETTTTSPSGLHLGHYKALICRHAYSATRRGRRRTSRETGEMESNATRSFGSTSLRTFFWVGRGHKRKFEVLNKRISQFQPGRYIANTMLMNTSMHEKSYGSAE